MKRMLVEEKALRERLHELLGINAQLVGKQVTALVRACYEDAAKPGGKGNDNDSDRHTTRRRKE